VDGLPDGEGSFTACSFWFVECLARAGQFEKRSYCLKSFWATQNHLGLYSEQLGANGTGKTFPILVGHVLYNGTHGGDSVPMELMPQLREEVSQLFAVHCDEPSTEAFLRGFEQTMQALCADAEALDRPICF